MERGVLVASDSNMEWLLPWWWERYEYCNNLPVAFVDLGMTKEGRAWCEKKGEVLTITQEVKEECISFPHIKKWGEAQGSHYLKARKAWFKKPLACLLTPFTETVWIDLDCEILNCIEPIFSCLEEDKEMAVAFDRITAIPEGFVPDKNLEGAPVFNGGVIVFRKESEIIKEWARIALTESHLYWGDDYILSVIIHRLQEKVQLLPPIYNWRFADGAPFYAKIIHWCGEAGKAYIAKKGGLKGVLEGLPELKKIFDT